MHERTTLRSFTIIALFLCASAVRADDVLVRPAAAWTNLFSNTSVKFEYAIQSGRDEGARAAWSLDVAERTIASGESQVALTKNLLAGVRFDVSTPSLNDSNVLQADLTVTIMRADGKASLGEHRKTLWIFDPDTFTNRSSWLKQLDVTLFDPKRNTAKRFDAEKIPYHLVRQIPAPDGAQAGLVVVGEGASFKVNRGLADALVAAATRGQKVLCLAPADGQLPWLAPTSEQPLRSVLLQDLSAITNLDKRLDAREWYPGSNPIVSSFRTEARGTTIYVNVTGGPGGWPWMEMGFPSGGAVIICGCGIINHWDDSPTPRYLLRALFERLQSAKDAKERQPVAKE